MFIIGMLTTIVLIKIQRKEKKMSEEKVVKMQKIEQCIICKWNKFFVEEKFYRSRCTNPEATRENGNCRIINRKLLMRGRFPGFCPLEDYTIFREANRT